MSEFGNDTFLRALRREPISHTPVWVMRQAGRYLPEYRKLREKTPDFMTFCKTPELACEATLQPLELFDLDASIIFSDILTIPEAMGLELHFKKGEGPVFNNPICDETDFKALKTQGLNEKLDYVMQAITLTVNAIGGKVPLIGFSGSPFTLACYMVEGSGSKTFSKTRAMMYRRPHLLESLLDSLHLSIIHYLKAQVKAGVAALMLFDTWGGILSETDYLKFSLRYMGMIVAELKRDPLTKDVPVILFTKNGGAWLERMVETGCDALGIDWCTNLADARARVGDRVALQGNLDPACLYAEPDRIRQEIKSILNVYHGTPGHIFNLGHGIYPDIPPEHVKVLVDTVHEYSTQGARV